MPDDLADKPAQDADEGGLPPFVRSWRSFYLLVIGNFVLLVLLFYGIQAIFA